MARSQKPCMTYTRMFVHMMVIILVVVAVLESLALPSKIAFSSSFPPLGITIIEKSSLIPEAPSIPLRIGKLSLLSDRSKFIASSTNQQTNIIDGGEEEFNEEILEFEEARIPLEDGSSNLVNKFNTTIMESENKNKDENKKKKKKKKEMLVVPPVYHSEMNQMLHQNRASYRSTVRRPLWRSERDEEILAAKSEIENAPIISDDREPYVPIYRNISMFKRSYELMEKMLKVYVYKEGEKPIMHQPLLKGIYASEGWFMKLMESNNRFLVTDPAKAHLFYMPFSSCILRFHLYDPATHNRGLLDWYLRNYVHTIAAKYPFWNRTSGADHFLAACHDWAPSHTKLTMQRAIRALCSADLRNGFRLGMDISLPQTPIRNPKHPLVNLGGRPPRERPTLAFFAGNTHGGLRQTLLEHWENKDPDVKIYGQSFRRAETNTTYVEHMKRSKYCICPRGYEVNSPRVVEAIFYECVPVIIADNYVPPFFEVLNWEAFSVMITEKDVSRLKEILVSIPEHKYLFLQKGVREVQKHFLWHNKPAKYDAFHMVLHSVWFSRVFTI